jgi:hypothetical protein
LKVIEPVWQHDPFGSNRELYYYQRIAPRLDIPKPEVYFCTLSEETNQRVILMGDLSISHYIPPSDHLWTRAELISVLRAYARFHTAARPVLPPLEQRSWLYTYPDEPMPTAELEGMAAELHARGLFPPLPCLSNLAEYVSATQPSWNKLPVTLNHNDVYPSNAALPRLGGNEVILLDWDMVGWGPAEMDLAYLFLQPYRSNRSLTQLEALRIYWTERQRIEGMRLPEDTIQATQRLADARLALALLPVAYRAALQPYPPGSKAWRYWESMFGVLGERLTTLTETR